MDVRSRCPLPAASLLYRPRKDRWRLAIVCKATHKLLPGQARLASTQEPLYAEEQCWQQDRSKSIERPADLVPAKPRVDVVLVGSAHAPRRAPARSISVRLSVGEIDKSLEVCCARTLSADGIPRDGALVTSVPLRWELAAGGHGTTNPVGVPQDVHPAFGSRVLPQIQPAGWLSGDPGAPIPIAGLGPIGAAWPSRRDRLGARAASFREGDWNNEVLGDDFDLAYFQVAPPDQQLEELRPDESIVLENLLPDVPRLVTNLPGLLPRAFLHARAGAVTPIALRADTLWLDTDRGICTVTYRGHLDLARPTEPGTVYVVLEKADKEISAQELEERLGISGPPDIASDSWLGEPPVVALNAAAPATSDGFDPNVTMELDPTLSPSNEAVLPFQPKDASTPSSDADDEARTAVMNIAAMRAELERRPAPETTASIPQSALLNTGSGLPFVKPSTPPPGSAPPMQAPSFGPPPQPPSKAPSPDPAPARPAAPAAAAPAAAAPAPQPALAAPAPAAPAPQPTLAGPAPPPAPAAPAPAPWDRRRLGPSMGSASSSSAKPDEGKQMMLSAAGYAGVLSASNAAARREGPGGADQPRTSATPQSEPPDTPAGKSIELIWYDSAFVARMKKHPEWASLFKPPPKAPAPVFQRGKPPPPPSREALSQEAHDEEQKAEVFDVLSRAEASSESEYLWGGGDAARGSAPLHLLSGSLSFPLDDIEMLKATVAAAAPMAANDKKLREVLDFIEGVLKMPLEGAPEVTSGFILRIREAWSKANRFLPSDHLVTHTERLLLNQRQYVKRELLDEEWIRALFSSDGSTATIPTYVPAKLSKRLPLFRQFPARLIVDVLPQQDMYESHPVALRVVALARLLEGQAKPGS
jgi:hypothetical protein